MKLEKDCAIMAVHQRGMLTAQHRAEEKGAEARRRLGEAAAAAAAAAAAKNRAAAADNAIAEGENFAVKQRAELADLEVLSRI
jgi:hypothetical protein